MRLKQRSWSVLAWILSPVHSATGHCTPRWCQYLSANRLLLVRAQGLEEKMDKRETKMRMERAIAPQEKSKGLQLSPELHQARGMTRRC